MLVRAKRLAWEGNEDRAVSYCGLGAYCVYRFTGPGDNSANPYFWHFTQGAMNPCDSLDHGKQLCQLDFDRRWLESTEVCELVWEDCGTESTARGIYEYSVQDKCYWIGDDYNSWPCDSREHGKAICQKRETDTILGPANGSGDTSKQEGEG